TGRLIVVEGGEGVGKSTQVERLAASLRADGREVVITYEPGDTKTGAELRAALLHADAALDPRTELLLLLADRAQHVADAIGPARNSTPGCGPPTATSRRHADGCSSMPTGLLRMWPRVYLPRRGQSFPRLAGRGHDRRRPGACARRLAAGGGASRSRVPA